MNRSELVQVVADQGDLPRKQAETLVNAIFDCMTQTLLRDERIEIRGFGSFTMRHYEGYQGRNPKTGSTVTVPHKRLPFFKVGKELRERVNDGA